MLLKKTFLSAAATLALVSAFVACGDDKKDDDKTTPAATAAPTTAPTAATGDTTKTLPDAYSACALCHGDDGTTVVGGSKKLAGTALSETAFVSFAQAGGGSMPAQSISAEDAKKVWEYFKK